MLGNKKIIKNSQNFERREPNGCEWVSKTKGKGEGWFLFGARWERSGQW